jgi:hypothetical protein
LKCSSYSCLIRAGLATKRLKKPMVNLTTNEYSEGTDNYEASEDFSVLLGENSKLSESVMSSAYESLTGGGKSISTVSAFCVAWYTNCVVP